MHVVVGPGTETDKPKSSALRPVGIAVAAVGVVGIGVGVVTGVMALDRANTVKQHCNTTTNVCADSIGLSAAQDGAVLAPLSTTMFIAGSVLTALGAVFFIVGGPSSSRAKARMALTPSGLLLDGTF